MSHILRNKIRNQKGQAITEYVIILAIVAIASIGLVTIFGKQIRSIFSASSKQLSGDEAAQASDESTGADAEIGRDIDDF